MSKHSSDIHFLSALLTPTHFSLRLVPHFIYSFPHQVSHDSLASPTSWSLQYHPSFTFTASHTDLFGPPSKHTPGMYLASTVFLSFEGRFHNPFLVSLMLNLEQCGQSCLVFCAWYSGHLTPSHKYIFNFLSRFPLKNPLDLMDFPLQRTWFFSWSFQHTFFVMYVYCFNCDMLWGCSVLLICSLLCVYIQKCVWLCLSLVWGSCFLWSGWRSSLAFNSISLTSHPCKSKIWSFRGVPHFLYVFLSCVFKMFSYS